MVYTQTKTYRNCCNAYRHHDSMYKTSVVCENKKKWKKSIWVKDTVLGNNCSHNPWSASPWLEHCAITLRLGIEPSFYFKGKGVLMISGCSLAYSYEMNLLNKVFWVCSQSAQSPDDHHWLTRSCSTCLLFLLWLLNAHISFSRHTCLGFLLFVSLFVQTEDGQSMTGACYPWMGRDSLKEY